MGKTLNHAVLDSGCKKGVCAFSWLDNYLETLSPEDRENVLEKQSKTKFRFGDGETLGYLKSVVILVQIGDNETTIQIDAVSCELPPLLRKDAVKKANTKVDLTNDKISILGQEMDIRFTTSGHYSILMSKRYENLNKYSQENYDNFSLSNDHVALKTPNEKGRRA